MIKTKTKMKMKTNKIAIPFLLAILTAFAVSGQSQQAGGTTAQTPAASSPASSSPASSSPGSPDALETSVTNDVVYATVNGSALRLDIYEPADRGKERYPAVVLIHGGGWSRFDKSTMRGMGQFLARSGYVAFSVDYRLYHGTENRWPAQFDDVQRAVRWIRANAEKYGVNPDRIGSFGHSAGAQLASLLGMEDTRDNSDAALAKFPSRVQAVVDASGPTDFTTGHDAESNAFFAAFLGADLPKDPELWRSASPVFHVSKDNAPFLIVHGTEDHNVPMAQAQELYDKLRAAGVDAKFVKVDDQHTFQTPEARRQLAVESLEFFNRYLIQQR